uniref:estradiol 17-beta-dehydrogenase 11-like n=1 Tax=Euleptes europaea TaxID=460621 RepID=UPI00253FA326|nr:estradiol 17-beta-dehydrogenase 11-like [Euleptes europaea]
MHLLLQGVMIVFIVLYYYVEALVKLFIPKKKKSLSGEIVLITGAAHGLGREIACAFSKHQCKLALWDINKHGIEETAEECRKLGAAVHTYVVDCRKREEIYRTADKVKKDIGDISILINNAGVITTGCFLSVTDEQIQSMFDINVLAHYWTVKAFLPAMMERNHGHIVTVASLAGFVAVPFMVTYVSSKHGIVGFHQSLTEELFLLGKDGIKTSCLCPSFINNGFVKNLPKKAVPTVETEDVVNKLMEGILTNQKTIFVPQLAKLFTIILRLLPERVYNSWEIIERDWIDSYRNQCQRSK